VECGTEIDVLSKLVPLLGSAIRPTQRKPSLLQTPLGTLYHTEEIPALNDRPRPETLQERMDNHLPSLSLPVVGDRVEVLWRGELHPAEVVKCHRTGEYNVVYETDGTVRTFLTREDNRLVPLHNAEKGEEVEIDEEEAGRDGGGREEEVATVHKNPAGAKRRRCVMEGCTKGAKVRGACITHGAYGMCLIGDCTTMAANKSQRCFKHGAKGLCTVPGCTTNARKRGLCVKHGGSSKGVCVHPGCTTKANIRGLCVKHGGSTKGVCVHLGCTTRAYARGLCKKHGAKGMCVHPGCTTNANVRGLCFKHGGVGKITPCHAPDCPPPAKAHGLCFKHGAFGICPVGDCPFKVHVRGRCKKHNKACNSK
jgi:hypothetical protein